MAAAIRASVAAQQQQQQQQETRRSEDREEGGRPKKEEAGVWGPEEPHGPRRPPRTQGEGPGELAFPAGSSALAPEAGGRLPTSLVPTLAGPPPTRPAGTCMPPCVPGRPQGLILPLSMGRPWPRLCLCLVGAKEASTNGPVSQEAFSASGPAAGATLPR